MVRLEDSNNRLDSGYEKTTVEISADSDSILKSVQESLYKSGWMQKEIDPLGVSMSMSTVTPLQLLAECQDSVIISPVNATIYTALRHNYSKLGSNNSAG